MLDTIEGNYEVIQDHLQRIRDLTEQSANGTYSEDSLTAISSEINQRLDEITRVANSTEYNGLDLLNGDFGNGQQGKDGIDLQVGITSSTNSVIHLDGSLFNSIQASALTWMVKAKNTDGKDVDATGMKQQEFADTCAGLGTKTNLEGTKGANQMLAVLDKAIATITERTTLLGATQNRLESASDALQVQSDNLTSSLSTVRDADVASESSAYISAQILQSASASLLSTANQTPSIALNLI